MFSTHDYRPNWTPLSPITIINPLSPNIHLQILQTDLYIFP